MATFSGSNSQQYSDQTRKNLGIMGGIASAPPSRPIGEQNNGGYGYGYQTNFSPVVDRYAGAGYEGYGLSGTGARSSDPDVRRAQALTNELQAGVRGVDKGVDQGALAAQIKALQARIGLKNQLGGAIAQNPNEMGYAIENQRNAANEALSSGLKNTRENYNRRGLLYSGLREGGEQGIKEKVGANLASNIAGTKRDYMNTLSSEKAAYSSLGFAQQQADLERANQAFEITTKNNIARSQAYEQLGYGVGGLVGNFAGRNSQPAQTNSPYQSSYATERPSSYGLANSGTNSANYWTNNPYSQGTP